MIQKVDFFGKQVSKLILGDNPFTGHSYIPEIYDGDEMINFYTAERIVKTLFEAEKLGINTFLPLANDFMLRVIRQYRNQGGKMHIIFQPYPAIDLKINMHMMMKYNPLAIYHQGTSTDILWEAGNIKQILDNIKLLRSSGKPVGLATHMPEVVMQAESENWDIDFYLTCLYNARRDNRLEESGFITGKSKHIKFYPSDRFLMFNIIKDISKPCIVYKIFAGGQIFYNKTQEEIRAAIEDTYKETYKNIKPNDIACVGVFQKHKNQLRENTDIISNMIFLTSSL